MAESREDKIMKLASSLKASGFAKTDGQARMLAEDMIDVETKVQQRFEEQHSQVREFLKTAKNLKDTRTIKPEPKKEPVAIQPIKSQRDLGTSQSEVTRQEPKQDVKLAQKQESKPVKSFDEEAHEQIKQLQEVKTDVHLGSKSLRDMMLGQIEEEHHKIETIEELEEKQESKPVEEEVVEETKEEPVKEETKIELPPEQKPQPEPMQEDINEETANEETANEEPIKEETKIELPPEEAPKLDANKLVEMMEEDGKMEEHTREIKEKPKNVKPKEEYEENNIDLATIFNANKK